MEKIIYRIGEKLPEPLFYFFLQVAIAIYLVLFSLFIAIREVFILLWTIIKIPYHMYKFCLWGIKMLPLLTLLPKYLSNQD